MFLRKQRRESCEIELYIACRTVTYKVTIEASEVDVRPGETRTEWEFYWAEPVKYDPPRRPSGVSAEYDAREDERARHAAIRVFDQLWEDWPGFAEWIMDQAREYCGV